MSGTPYGIDSFRMRDISQPICTSVSVLTTTTAILASSEKRAFVYLCNLNTTNTVWLHMSSTSSGAAVGRGIRLNKNGSSGDTFQTSMGIESMRYRGNIYGTATATATKVNVVYYNEG